MYQISKRTLRIIRVGSMRELRSGESLGLFRTYAQAQAYVNQIKENKQ